ncbi:hypothetical protein P7C70_g7695, partial [Phenoliferia sp. Uapishka_3]
MLAPTSLHFVTVLAILGQSLALPTRLPTSSLSSHLKSHKDAPLPPSNPKRSPSASPFVAPAPSRSLWAFFSRALAPSPPTSSPIAVSVEADVTTAQSPLFKAPHDPSRHRHLPSRASPDHPDMHNGPHPLRNPHLYETGSSQNPFLVVEPEVKDAVGRLKKALASASKKDKDSVSVKAVAIGDERRKRAEEALEKIQKMRDEGSLPATPVVDSGAGIPMSKRMEKHFVKRTVGKGKIDEVDPSQRVMRGRRHHHME